MNKPTILIIDDEPQIRKLLDINLSSKGYMVRQAESGKEGLLLASSHFPDAILLDLGLPDLNGHEVLRQLRTQWQGIHETADQTFRLLMRAAGYR